MPIKAPKTSRPDKSGRNRTRNDFLRLKNIAAAAVGSFQTKMLKVRSSELSARSSAYFTPQSLLFHQRV